MRFVFFLCSAFPIRSGILLSFISILFHVRLLGGDWLCFFSFAADFYYFYSYLIFFSGAKAKAAQGSLAAPIQKIKRVRYDPQTGERIEVCCHYPFDLSLDFTDQRFFSNFKRCPLVERILFAVRFLFLSLH